MTTASKITLARVVMIPVFMVLLLLGYNIPALIVFIVAVLLNKQSRTGIYTADPGFI